MTGRTYFRWSRIQTSHPGAVQSGHGIAGRSSDGHGIDGRSTEGHGTLGHGISGQSMSGTSDVIHAMIGPKIHASNRATRGPRTSTLTAHPLLPSPPRIG